MAKKHDYIEFLSNSQWLQQINNIYESMDRLTQIAPIIQQSLNLENSLNRTFEISRAGMIKQIQGVTLAMENGFLGYAEQMTNITNTLQGISQAASIMSENHLSILKNLVNEISTFDNNIINIANQFDWSNLEFNVERKLILYDNEEVSLDDFNKELVAVNELSVVEKENITVKDKYEQLKAKYWIIFLILYIIWVTPEVVDKMKWYANVVPKLMEKIFDNEDGSENTYVFVIKESAVIREEPNSKSPIKYKLLYDSPLRVISTVPRWIEVEYTEDDGNIIQGWISKISVEYDENADINTFLRQAIIKDGLSFEATDGQSREKSKFGDWEGKIHIAEDFDEPLEDFKEYM
jgi:hypothetical protein